MGIVDRAMANSVPMMPRPVVLGSPPIRGGGTVSKQSERWLTSRNKAALQRWTCWENPEEPLRRRRAQAGVQTRRRCHRRERLESGISVKLTGARPRASTRLCGTKAWEG